MISGRDKLDTNLWSPYLGLTVLLPLEPFTEAEAHDYLVRRGIPKGKVFDSIIQLSGRLPVFLATLAETSPGADVELDDVCQTAVERFLKWEDDPIKRELALNASVPRYLNQDILSQVTPKEEVATLFNWLQSKPFVQKRAGKWTYHPVVREQMLR